ncbi:response regulator [Litoreibacter roseus]|uniref:Response regulatory domain-containing protein n=1 Tax=Litoreibacter roseus TaxID=2601869 RepID=A0A6N6JD29_9RHOB|nr:response regulator [Litoreibacter roseus]GFE63730.1 hypothetical protein KIN_08040 [Litoreibacter roseus]
MTDHSSRDYVSENCNGTIPVCFSDAHNIDGHRYNPERFDEDLSDRLSGRSVLVVEDEALVAYELELELVDCRAIPVGPATTVSVAMELAETKEIDAAILDIDLNGRDVYPLADKLRARGVPFVFHTGHGTLIDLEDTYPGIPVCIKPCGADDVLGSLASVMRRSQ